jgi:type IV secretory pathway VirB10-like protein
MSACATGGARASGAAGSAAAAWQYRRMNMRWAERAPVVVMVLLAHAALLWAWRFAATPAPRERVQDEPRSVTLLRLIEARPREPQLQPPRAPAAPRSPATTTRLSVPRPDAAPPPVAPLAITVPAAAEPAASPLPRALDLSLPRAEAAPAQRTMNDQMRNDPRANSPRTNIESRVAAVAGSSAMTQERMDDTKTRFRQHGECIEVHVSRDAQTNPWNQNHSPTPKIVKPSC